MNVSTCLEIRLEQSYTETCNPVENMHGRMPELVGYCEQHKKQQEILILSSIAVTFLFPQGFVVNYNF
jgi:hypothetical protein